MTTTKFEEIIGNPRIFKIILDEFFHDWPGSYDIMPVENPRDRKFTDYNEFAGFCEKIRSNEEGLRRCINCDLEFAEKARIHGKPLYYTCHAGLMDIAVPIIVDNKLVATIFCGQHRSKDQVIEKNAIQKTQTTETELGFKHGELLKLRNKTHILDFEKIQSVEEKLWEVATYVSNLGSSKLEAEQAKKELSTRLRETDAIQNILLVLSEVLDDIDIFWRKLDAVLEKICEIIGADCGIFATCNPNSLLNEDSGFVRSVAYLPSDLLGGYLSCNPIISEALAEMKAMVYQFSSDQFSDKLFYEIEKYLLDFRTSKVAVVPVKLEPEREGIMLFFISENKDTNKRLSIEDGISLLTQAGTQIATSYGNCILYQRQKELARIQKDWLENVSHQILAPINGILGQTENLSKNYRAWQKTNPQKIDNTFVSLRELAEWTSRMAKNFAWVANEQNHPRELNLRLEDDVPGRLIGYARDMQGFARTRDITKVHVDTESVIMLNNKIAIDNKLFKQAVTNLLDNAIKYADPNTEVLITGAISATHCFINIIDFGVPISSQETEEIFDRYYRTKSAIEKYSVGSGIGLGIAREIIRLHKGDLAAKPSVQIESGWKTTFVISLPLK